MTTVTIVSGQGGLGKTTTAVNLAAVLAAAGQRVLLLGLREGADAWLGLTLSPQSLFSSALQPVPTALRGLDLIQTAPEHIGVDRKLLGPDPSRQLQRVVESCSRGYDVVIVDPPPCASSITDSAIVAADLTIGLASPGPIDRQFAADLVERAKHIHRDFPAPVGKAQSIRALVTLARAQLAGPSEIAATRAEVPVEFCATTLRWSASYRRGGETRVGVPFLPALVRGSRASADISSVARDLRLVS